MTPGVPPLFAPYRSASSSSPVESDASASMAKGNSPDRPSKCNCKKSKCLKLLVTFHLLVSLPP